MNLRSIVRLALVALAVVALTSGVAAAAPGIQRETASVAAYFEEPTFEGPAIVGRPRHQGLRLLLPAVQAQLHVVDGAEGLAGELLPANMQQRLRLDLDFFDEADALFGKARVSGKTEARLDNGLRWRGKVDGTGTCIEYDDSGPQRRCSLMELDFTMAGRVAAPDDDRTNGGRMNLAATARLRLVPRDIALAFMPVAGPHASGDLTLGVMPGDNVSLE